MKIRLAILTRNFSMTGGGAEKLAVSLATSMLKECEITVISQGFAESPTKFQHIQVPEFPIRTRWLNQLWFNWYTKRSVKLGFDVVHSYENISHGQVQTVSVKTVHASLKQRRMSSLRIALSPRLLAYLWLEKERLCNPSHHKVFVSQFLSDETLEVLPEIVASSVIPPGVHIPEHAISSMEKSAARMAFGLNPRKMTIGFVGHDFKKKGLATLLKATALLPFEAQVVVFGNPVHAHQYQDLVNALGEGKSCHFMGVISDMKMAYSSMDFLAHPTTQDTFPMVVLEAMAHRVPVITTSEPYNNMGALLVHRRNALLLSSPQDVEGMMTDICDVWQNDDLRQAMVVEAVQFAQQFSWDLAKQKYYEIYRKFAPQFGK
jgi:UDP-glucose:(heptosyl)LPS alpha-1,3-glucosyltransferase